ncbi:MAG: thioredoxin family protein [Micrococcaceae bacterium]
MATLDLNEDNFLETVQQNGIVLVDFWVGSCKACETFKRTFDEASKKHNDIVFGKIDTGRYKTLAKEIEIISRPTLRAYRDGIQVFTQAGALPAETLESVIDQVRALDMDDIHKQVKEMSETQV